MLRPFFPELVISTDLLSFEHPSVLLFCHSGTEYIQPFSLLMRHLTKSCPYDRTWHYYRFHTPVFRRNVLWYGDVCPAVRPSIRPSVRVSVRQSQFSALFSYMLWHIELKFGMSLSSYEHSIKFECRQFPSIFVGVMSLLKLWKIDSFPQFSPTCFDILSCNFAYDFVVLHFRSSSRVVNLRQFLWKLCPFWNLEYWKYTAFRSFLLHALKYWAKILHMTLSYCTTDQVRESSISVNFCRSYSLLKLNKLEILSFPQFSRTCFDILSWNFAYEFV